MPPPAKSTTPGRRKKTDQQYFDVGKVGRKTGITLKDTGVRDEHGLEPVSGIFSSPASPEQHGNRTLTSEGMEMQESAYIKSEEEASGSDEELMTRTRPGSAPDVTATLTNRKTPRTLARTSPLKRTTIGGTPRRMSSARPQSHAPHPSEDPETSPPVHGIVNRQLNFGLAHRERKSQPGPGTDSPFKPRHKIRRSTGTGRSDIYDLETEEGAGQTNDIAEGDETVEQSIEGDDEEPVLLEDPVEEDYTVQSVEEVATEAPSKRKRGRPRKSDQSNATSIDTGSPFVAPAPAAPIPSSSGTKRHRTSLENDDVPSARKRKRAPNASVVTVRRDDEEETIDPSLIAHGDEYVENVDNYEEEQPQLDSQLNANEEFEPEPEPEPVKKGRGRPKGKTSKAAAPKERDPNRAIQPRESPRKLTDSPSRNRGRGASAGPVSNVNLRAHTPALDAGNRASRTGRNLIAPLKFWENESRIWRNGEIEGIIRAEPVDVSRPKPKRKKRGRPNKHSLDDIEEESETESVMPDDWEDEMGVITGNVASWNADLKQGDPEDPYQEDIAFAASSIVTRDVAGSDFKYAKIMTIPFFGAGVVEVPPEGYKRAKNSRKMQMVFFVHEGKVTVEVGATGMEVNQFGISKGGVWIVPRGNNYAITNVSTKRTARIFFAQGCEVERTDPALSQ